MSSIERYHVNCRNDAAGSLDLVEVLRVSLPSLGPISVGLCALHWSGSVFFLGRSMLVASSPPSMSFNPTDLDTKSIATIRA